MRLLLCDKQVVKHIAVGLKAGYQLSLLLGLYLLIGPLGDPQSRLTQALLPHRAAPRAGFGLGRI